MSNVIGHELEIDVFDNVILFDESHEFFIAGGTIKIREMGHHFEATIEFLNYKSLFDGRIDNRCHNINSLFRRILPFSQGCNSSRFGESLLGILP